MNSLLSNFDLKPVDLVTNNHKRNPHRILRIEKAEGQVTGVETHSDSASNVDALDKEIIGLLDENHLKQIKFFQAHRDVIKQIKYISETDIPIIFTTGLDKMAKIWVILLVKRP